MLKIDEYLHEKKTESQTRGLRKQMISPEETFGSEEQCVSFLNFINSETTLADYKKGYYFPIAVKDMAAILRTQGHDVDPRDLFKVQPCFSESKFETTIGYNDPRFRHMFLGNIASSLPSYEGW